MHVYFSGIGGTGIGPLALIAHRAGYSVSGSDKQPSSYIEYLKKHGITDITIGQTTDTIAAAQAAQPIDWFVYSSALPRENPNHPELRFVADQHIRASKRDEFLNHLLDQKKLQLIAIAGTHGKTTTTAMTIWALKQLGVPLSYSVGAKLSFGEMGEYDPQSHYFVYECDEYDRNFLSFRPHLAMITGVDWDHADVYPTRQGYEAAFVEFVDASQTVVWWQEDHDKRLAAAHPANEYELRESDIPATLILPGLVNRRNAWQVANALHQLLKIDLAKLLDTLNQFPGVSRRFEQLSPGLYSEYAHTPRKIEGALQLAHEVAGDHVVVVYEGLHNTRQHFIKDELAHLFDSARQVYVVPSYLAREDPNLVLLSPTDLIGLMAHPERAMACQLNDDLRAHIKDELAKGNLVLALSAGGGGSLDEWLRQNFNS